MCVCVCLSVSVCACTCACLHVCQHISIHLLYKYVIACHHAVLYTFICKYSDGRNLVDVENTVGCTNIQLKIFSSVRNFDHFDIEVNVTFE